MTTETVDEEIARQLANDPETLRIMLRNMAVDAVRLREALQIMLSVPGDHMSACDRIMGDSHPCTCGADAARQLLK